MIGLDTRMTTWQTLKLFIYNRLMLGLPGLLSGVTKSINKLLRPCLNLSSVTIDFGVSGFSK